MAPLRVRIFVTLWLVSLTAGAEVPAVATVGSAECPTAAAVQREIRPFTRSPAPGRGSYRLEVAQLGHGARLDLYDSSDQLQFSRSLESEDCDALARAFALILRAHFEDLGIVERDLDSAPSVEEPPEPVKMEPARATPTRPAPASEARAVEDHEPSSPSRWGVSMAMAAGGALDLPDFSPSAALVLQVGAAHAEGFWFGLHFRGASRVRVGDSPDRVERWPLAAEVGLSQRWGSAWWLEPHLSGGVQASRVEAIDVETSPRISFAPMLRGALRTGQLYSGSSIWLELGASLLLDRDRYLIQPRGQVGLGPRSTAMLLIGLDHRWF